MLFSIVVPTYNAGYLWKKWIQAYQLQSVKANQVIVIDSSSSDQTASLASQAGFVVHSISQNEFDHGGTRNFAIDLLPKGTEIVVFLTQDAILAEPDSLANLIASFSESDIAAVCGRQLPHKDANPLATYARIFNYPCSSSIKSKANIPSLGIKVAFMSNSFAAYRLSIFKKLNGFPTHTILAEDMYLAAKIILGGYKIVYNAKAMVYHSHNYSIVQEFQRYFDIGVFQKEQEWIQKSLGSPHKEGTRFVLSELAYLWEHNPIWIPKSLLSTLAKYLGFKLGMKWSLLPKWVIKKCSMHKGYWR